ncbi:MAG: hypothetical protein Q9163_000123 [Psora crenata]
MGARSQHHHSRSLSDKMRNLHMKMKREQDVPARKPQAAVVPAPSVKKPSRHLDRLEAASQTDFHKGPPPKGEDTTRTHTGSGKDNGDPSGANTTHQPPPPFQGDRVNRQSVYSQYLSRAFGLDNIGPLKPQTAWMEPLTGPVLPAVRPNSNVSAMTTDSMEVNFHMVAEDLPGPSIPSAKDRRPKIHLQIPGKAPLVKRSPSTTHLVTQMSRQKTKSRARHPSTQISPPSATAPQRIGSEAPARLSIVSPLSAVEMPKPRRPFSAFSLEEMTSDASPDKPKSAPLMEKSHSANSSDGTGERDDRSSTYSQHSSMSSLSTSERPMVKVKARRHSIAFSIADPAAAGVFDTAPMGPLLPRSLTTMKSTASLTPNTNKPLPPEPGMEEVAPLRLPGQSFSRGNTFHPKRKAPNPLTISRSSSAAAVPFRMSSVRSRYHPAYLDVLDAAFMESSYESPWLDDPQESSWEQAQNDLESHLDTITEDGLTSEVVPLMHEPLQISRGLNDMMPSRHAPPPPWSMDIKLSDGSISSRKRLRRQPSRHVVMQMKSDGHRSSSSELRKRISAPVGGSLIKANRILGKSGSDDGSAPSPSTTTLGMGQEPNSDSSASSSPETYTYDSSSPNMSNRGDADTPETDAGSVPDHAFEEVRARMELLSPKNDTFAWTHWGPAQPDAAVALPIQAHGNGRPWPTTCAIDVAPEETMTDPVPDIQVHLIPAKDNDNAHQCEIAVQLDEPIDAMAIHPRERRASGVDSIRPRSLASIAMSEIPDMYAEMPSSEEELSPEEMERMISADAAEKVLLRILAHLDNLQDLFATATVSRGFYRTFKRHELPLMKNALYSMSPAAWELREMTPPYPGLQGEGNASPRLDYTPPVYLQHYMRDMYTMIALKSMILIHCESFLRGETITALAGGETERASQIDDAFWRVWTFCQIFGCGSNREDDIVAQMDWLRGGPLTRQQKRKETVDRNKDSAVFSPSVSFGCGNLGGLSAEGLYDMTEIWTCLGVLVRGFQGKRQEARDSGVFDKAANLTAGDVEGEDSVLEEWTYHLLTLAPPTILDVTSPTTPTAATFAHARSRGYTTWSPPPISRATFLKEAVSRVYQERIALVHPNSAPCSPQKAVATIDPASPMQLQQESPDQVVLARRRCAKHAAEIKAKRSEPSFKTLPASEDRPMSNYPDVVGKLDKLITPGAAPPMPTLPARALGTHSKTPSEIDTSKNMVSALVVPRGPQVRDPVDVAVEKLVGMGFEPAKAKKALAITDTGNSIDFDAALEHLVRERKRDVEGLMHLGYRGQKDDIDARMLPPIADGGVGLGLEL